MYTIKNKAEILQKLGIESFNAMQEEAHEALHSNTDVVLLSPTGSGKTLAYLFPVMEMVDLNKEGVQILVLVPSRELAQQIEQVARRMGTGIKVNAVYGGRAGMYDKLDFKLLPALLIGTPGRIADHLRKESFSTDTIRALVLDEFDKSLEVGFEEDMKEIIQALPNLEKRVLTSATQKLLVPEYTGLTNPYIINYLEESDPNIDFRIINAKPNQKLLTLAKTLLSVGNEPGIVFCNFKDDIELVSDFLEENNIPHGVFHGGLEQKDRDRALIKFRNGTHRLIVATDLAARGIDVPEIRFIIHYQLPPKEHEFIHRNGRTARMNRDGAAYLIIEEGERIPDFIRSKKYKELQLSENSRIGYSTIVTLYVSGGRRDKISKADIAGLFIKQGNLIGEELGLIEIKQDCTYVAVPAPKANQLIKMLNNSKLKNKKIRLAKI